MLRLKPGREGVYGDTGLMDSREADDDGLHVSAARKGDVDWEAMGTEQVEQLRTAYRELGRGLQSTPWSLQREPDETEDQFVRRNFKPFATFAFLDRDGEWHEQGRMGWWGTVRDPTDDWPERFAGLLADVRDDEWVCVVDVHI